MIKKILFTAVCVSISLLSLNPVLAQETEEAVELQPLSEDVTADFDQMSADIVIQREDIGRIEAQLADSDGLAAEILGARRDRLRTAMYRKIATLARDAAAQRANGKDISAYYNQLVNDLSGFPDDAYETVRRLRGRAGFPSPDLPPEEFVVAAGALLRLKRVKLLRT